MWKIRADQVKRPRSGDASPRCCGALKEQAQEEAGINSSGPTCERFNTWGLIANQTGGEALAAKPLSVWLPSGVNVKGKGKLLSIWGF